MAERVGDLVWLCRGVPGDVDKGPNCPDRAVRRVSNRRDPYVSAVDGQCADEREENSDEGEEDERCTRHCVSGGHSREYVVKKGQAS